MSSKSFASRRSGKYQSLPNLTALQKHVGYFDRNGDGIVFPWETYAGLRALGFNVLIALASVVAFHVLHVSYWTQPSWFLDPLFPVYLHRIHRAKHGSDTETFDEDGKFTAAKFERTFEKYDASGKDGLYFGELVNMWVGNRNVLDPVGWIFQVVLWAYLWMLAADENGVLHKEDVRKQYDGTLYYEIEERRLAGERLPWWRGGSIL